jgi:hypothetical protein
VLDVPFINRSAQGYMTRLLTKLVSPEPPSFFQVQYPRIHGEPRVRGARQSTRRSFCRKLHRRYNSSIHWSWQTNLGLQMWTPEIYQSVALPITVVRLVKVDKIKRLLNPESDKSPNHEKLLSYLHFDFKVDARVREMGRCINFFKSTSKPPDKRVKSDSGAQLPPDRTTFCVICPPEKISCPIFETLNLQAAVEVYVKDVRLLPNFTRPRNETLTNLLLI